MSAAFTLKKASRLLKRADFIKISKTHRKWVSPNFLILTGDPVESFSRLGVTVSKKVGNSVSRNHVKRLIREFFRNNREMFPTADYNIIARSGAEYLSYAAVCQELANALKRIGQRNNH